MGQMTVGLLYGCQASEIPHNPDDEEAFYGIVQNFNNHAKIDWTSGKPRVRVESEGDRMLVGVWVAVGGSGEDGCPFFVDACVPVDQIEVVYGASIAKAKKLWTRFAKYLSAKHQIELPAAALWITPCEVA